MWVSVIFITHRDQRDWEVVIQCMSVAGVVVGWWNKFNRKQEQMTIWFLVVAEVVVGQWNQSYREQELSWITLWTGSTDPSERSDGLTLTSSTTNRTFPNVELSYDIKSVTDIEPFHGMGEMKWNVAQHVRLAAWEKRSIMRQRRSTTSVVTASRCRAGSA